MSLLFDNAQASVRITPPSGSFCNNSGRRVEGWPEAATPGLTLKGVMCKP